MQAENRLAYIMKTYIKHYKKFTCQQLTHKRN